MPARQTASSRCSWARRSARGRISSRPRHARCGTLTSEVALARPGGRSAPAARDSGAPSRRIEVEPHNCFACGTLNAHGLHLELHTEADRCWTRLTLSDRFEGWEGIAHGGILAAILDEVMAWALVGHDLWGLTPRMSVDFRRPVQVG